MGVLKVIFFCALIDYSWCGLILNNLSDNIHSKLYRPPGLYEEPIQSSPIININNQQQVQVANNHMLNGPRGDFGSLPLAVAGPYGSGLESNFKPVGISSYGHQGIVNDFNTGVSSYGSHQRKEGIVTSLADNMGIDMSSHQIMKQESFKLGDGHESLYHHGNNMFGKAQGVSGSSSSYIASSSLASSSLYGQASTSASSSTSVSSSSVNAAESLTPWNHRF